MKVLYVADLRSSISMDFLQAVRELSDIEFSALCSRTGALLGSKNALVATSDEESVMRASAMGSIALRPLHRILARARLAAAFRRSTSLRDQVERFEPHVVHSLRLFPEAVRASRMHGRAVHVTSVWGQELTRDATAVDFRLAARHLLHRVDGLTADCERDIELGRGLGLRDVPSAVLPGNLGVHPRFFDAEPDERIARAAAGRPVVLNPRGIRPYVRTREFLEAASMLRRRGHDLLFVLVDVAAASWIERFVRTHDLASSVLLLGRLDRDAMAGALRSASVVVSPTTSDGTPNSLLEAMAAGAILVASPLESIREWITPGVNGFLPDPRDPDAVARAIELALAPSLDVEGIRQRNVDLVRDRADRGRSVERLLTLYGAAASRADRPTR